MQDTAAESSVRKAGRAAQTSTGYFHGGYPGLRPGQLVEPASLHPGGAGGFAARQTDREETLQYRRDRVYVTQDRVSAEHYARLSSYGAGAGWAAGTVYEVEPLGELTLDPSNEADRQWCRAVLASRVHRGDDPESVRWAFASGWAFAFECERARVVRVVKTNVRMRAADVSAFRGAAQFLGPGWLWDPWNRLQRPVDRPAGPGWAPAVS